MEVLAPTSQETGRRPRRSWPFSGRPPSAWTVGGIALVYGALTSWWSGTEHEVE